VTGVLLNILTVIIGTAIGLIFGNIIADRFRQIAFLAIGSCTLGFGVIITVGGFGDLKSTNVGSLALLVPVFSLVAGGILGEALSIEDRLNSIAEWMEKRLIKPAHEEQASDDDASKGTGEKSRPRLQQLINLTSFIEGYMTATILFCVGAMTFLGSIQAGLGDPSILYLKSLLDGISAVALSCTLGIGVGFSVFSILVIQGGLALLGMFFGDFFTPAIIAAIDLVGGIMLIALGIEIIGIHKMRVANMLPSLILAMLLAWVLS